MADLSKLQNKKRWGQPRTYRYWSAPAYALDNGFVEPATLMKYLRELENVAKQLFPDSVPSSRRARPPLTDDEKREIRKRYLAGEDAKALAKDFRIPPSHVGLLCVKEKDIRAAAREQAQASVDNAQPIPVDDLKPF